MSPLTGRRRRIGVTFSLLALSPAWTAEGRGLQAPQDPVRVAIATEMGEIHVDIDVANAPVTASNFLRYVDGGLYEGGSFYRVVRTDNQPNDSVRIEVVQAGMERSRRDEAWPAIRLEGTAETGLRHLDGVISVARAGPDTGRAEFFICIGDQPELDEGGRRNPDGLGFAAFGRVTSGMEVVRAIQAGTTDGQRLVRPIRILRVDRLLP